MCKKYIKDLLSLKNGLAAKQNIIVEQKTLSIIV